MYVTSHLPQQAHLRQQALAKRAQLSHATRQAAAEAASVHALAYIDAANRCAQTLAIFLTLRDEIETLPLLRGLMAMGQTLCAPVVQGQGMPLLFRRFVLGEPVMTAAFGVRVPMPEQPIVVPDLLFVPLAAFDRRGGRIGYGGGFYDRTLRDLRATRSIRAIGYAFACQEVSAIPLAPHDERLDAIVCEEGLIEVALPGAGH